MNRPIVALLLLVALLGAGRSASAGAGGSPPPAPTATTTAVQTSPELATAMEKYADAIGGRPLLASIKNQTSVFNFTLMGRTLVVRTTAKAPSYFLQETQAEGGGGKIVVGFDGKTAWSQGPDGVTTILSGTKRAELISDAAGANNSELFPDRWPTTVVLNAMHQV